MNKIDSFLNNIYGNSQSLLYFYISLGAIALFFIILVLIVLFNAEKKSEQKYQKNKKENTDDKKDINQSLSETQVFNNILMNKEENEVVKTIIEEPNKEVEKTLINEDFYLEKDLEEPIEKTEDLEENNYEEVHVETTKEKPMDIDEYLARSEKERFKQVEVQNDISKEEDIIQEQPVEEIKPVELSNDELKNRLAKIKAKKDSKKEEIVPDDDLENLMKAVGLEDTTVIPNVNNEENQILGR